MLPIDEFEKSIITFGIEAALEYFGIEEGTSLYEELYDGFKEIEHKLNMEKKVKDFYVHHKDIICYTEEERIQVVVELVFELERRNLTCSIKKECQKILDELTLKLNQWFRI